MNEVLQYNVDVQNEIRQKQVEVDQSPFIKPTFTWLDAIKLYCIAIIPMLIVSVVLAAITPLGSGTWVNILSVVAVVFCGKKLWYSYRTIPKKNKEIRSHPPEIESQKTSSVQR